MGKVIPFKSKQKRKISVKTPEQKREETHMTLLNTIINETFTRHSDLSSKAFVKMLGGKKIDEDKAIDIAIYNLLVEGTKQMLFIENKINTATKVIREVALKNSLVEEEKEIK